MGRPNADAIAWYVEEAQRLLEDQQRRAESLKARGGQLAGFGAAVLALIGGSAATILDAAGGSARVAIGLTLLLGVFFLAAAVAVAIWGGDEAMAACGLGCRRDQDLCLRALPRGARALACACSVPSS